MVKRRPRLPESPCVTCEQNGECRQVCYWFKTWFSSEWARLQKLYLGRGPQNRKEGR